MAGCALTAISTTIRVTNSSAITVCTATAASIATDATSIGTAIAASHAATHAATRAATTERTACRSTVASSGTRRRRPSCLSTQPSLAAWHTECAARSGGRGRLAVGRVPPER